MPIGGEVEAFNYVLENREHWNIVALEFLEKVLFVYTARQTFHLFQRKREDFYQSATSSSNQVVKVLCRKE